MSMEGEEKEEKELQNAEETATQEEHAASAAASVKGGEKTAEELLEIGGAFLQEGKYEDAIRIYKEILKRRPTLPTLAKACNDCGVAYASLEQYELAVKFFNAAADLREYLIDDGISVFQNLARVYSLLGDEQKAERNRQIAENLRKEFIRRNQEIQQMFSQF
ncbi:MAG: tetratricopeptide repeat protein [Candidatus Methanospirare jalkutatii]|nr:tetratricopeptide repeat protein [Candidatus Methanospirare jalkutatii]